jgi:hypothetical protein
MWPAFFTGPKKQIPSRRDCFFLTEKHEKARKSTKKQEKKGKSKSGVLLMQRRCT